MHKMATLKHMFPSCIVDKLTTLLFPILHRDLTKPLLVNCNFVLLSSTFQTKTT